MDDTTKVNKYQIIYADPPWAEYGGGKIKRGADRHYPLMKTDDICKLNVPSDDNSHLYLWVTNNKIPDGLRVMESWGFKYKTIITWTKDRFGLGQYFRGNTEHCLFGVKGNLPYKIEDGKRQQGVTGFFAKRTIHSAKPQEMRDLINKVSYRDGYKRLEMFARQKTEGWDIWGNELKNDIDIFSGD
jgi:site-specific DNA-methyltransferase (adenine-specific)